MDQKPQHSFVRLGAALGITVSFFVVELIGGILTNSLALLADAWHMLNDASALVFALVAVWISKRPLDERKTYGYHRAEVLAAFLNGILLWVVVAFIFFEAFQRLQHPAMVQSQEMLVIAVLGLVANGLSAVMLSGHERTSLNIRGAFLHVLLDTLGSIGAILAGVLMYFTGFYSADPMISLFIGVLIFYSSYRLVRESANVLLEGVPYGIDSNAVRQRIAGLSGVKDVHDLHVWCITPDRICALSCHIVTTKETDGKRLTADIISMLQREFGIDHATIQIEDEEFPRASSEH